MSLVRRLWYWENDRMVPAAATSDGITERDLRGWKFVAHFLKLLEGARAALPPTPREEHGNRQLHAREYLALFLLGVFNPIVQSMRGLCAASDLARVQDEVCGHAVPPSRFSEAQAVFDP